MTKPVTVAKAPTHSLGPACATCGATEARCAFVGGCCDGCSHFDPPAQHGTERAFQAHRYDGEPACFSCRLAHARHNRERKS